MTYIVIAYLTYTTSAQIFLYDSCQELKGKNSEGVLTDYGDVRGEISIAIQEARVIARTARKYLIDVALGNGSPFDIHRTTQSFEVFMGTGIGIRTPKYRWQSLV